jgi:hypothetical protein
MINPKELQIGNRVWESNSFTPGTDDFDEIVIASINDLDKVIRDDQGNGYSYDSLYPIPLTPDWLERCGFVNGDKHRRSEYDGPNNITIGEVSADSNSFELLGSEWSIGNPFKYVHQLQNLYHSLTGEELTIKETV